MKTIKLFVLFILAFAAQSLAMEGTGETPISPEFNYFDKIDSYVNCVMSTFFLVSARHLPTMRTYSAFISSGVPIQGYYQEKGATFEQRVMLDDSRAATVLSTLMKIFPETPHSERKPLLDCLHTALFSGKQSRPELPVKEIPQTALSRISVK